MENQINDGRCASKSSTKNRNGEIAENVITMMDK